MKTKLLLILFIALGVTGCKKENVLDEKDIIEIVNQDKAETAVKNYLKDLYGYKPVSFDKLADNNSIKHTFKFIHNNVSAVEGYEYGKEYTESYIFHLTSDLSEVVTIEIIK